MIENDDQLRTTQDAIAALQAGLAALRRRVATANPALFEAMAQSYFADIQDLELEITEYLGTQQFGFPEVDLWMRLAGDIKYGNAASSALSVSLQSLRVAVQHLTEYIARGVARETGRVPRELADLVDFRVAGLAPGSLRVALKLPEQPPDMLFPVEGTSETTVAQAVNSFLEASSWVANSGTPEELAQRIPDEGVRSLAIEQVNRFIPSRESRVETVEFSGPLVPSREPIRLTRTDRRFIAGILPAISPGHVQVIEHSTREGWFRAIDFDKRRMTLRARPGERGINCVFPAESWDSARELADGPKVRVNGRQAGTVLYVEGYLALTN